MTGLFLGSTGAKTLVAFVGENNGRAARAYGSANAERGLNEAALGFATHMAVSPVGFALHSREVHLTRKNPGGFPPGFSRSVESRS